MSAPPVKTYVANEADAVTTWFVDEAGDPTLFGKGSKVVVATEGCSRFFIEGKLECSDVDALAADLDLLQAELLADPYLNGVPSLVDLDATPMKRRGQSRSEFVVFNKEHPLTLESRAGVGNKDREI